MTDADDRPVLDQINFVVLLAALRSPFAACASVSATRFAVFANIASTTRRIAPNSSTTRNASCPSNADASKESAIASSSERAVVSEANICSYHSREVRQERAITPIFIDLFSPRRPRHHEPQPM